MDDDPVQPEQASNVACVLGALFAGVVGLPLAMITTDGSVLAGLVFVFLALVPAGAWFGGLFGARFGPWLAGKNARQAVKSLIVTVGPVAVASGILGRALMHHASYVSGVLTLLPPLLFIYTCRHLSVTLPDIELKGHCRTCGYDLTGNASGVCSECGATIEAT